MTVPETVVLPPEPEDLAEALTAADASDDREAAYRDIVTRWPTCLDGWASLADLAYGRGDDVASYAFARTGYHRGLDRLRAAGWRGVQAVPWAEPSNRGVLRSLWALMRAAAAIGEGVEARRCRDFLLQLDPDDHLGVGALRPAALSRRLDGGRPS